tara:strand:- start:47 stop:361 length:315 start_codon:yes stop_codon:yes gene_type:complete
MTIKQKIEQIESRIFDLQDDLRELKADHALRTQTKQQKKILNLGDEITQEEIDLSQRGYSLLVGRKIIAYRSLFEKRKEISVVLDDGTTLILEGFKDKYDISIL